MTRKLSNEQRRGLIQRALEPFPTDCLEVLLRHVRDGKWICMTGRIVGQDGSV